MPNTGVSSEDINLFKNATRNYKGSTAAAEPELRSSLLLLHSSAGGAQQPCPSPTCTQHPVPR